MAHGICSIPGCDRTGKLNRGWCPTHYGRWWRTGSLDARKPPTVAERFWPKVNKTEACWLWTGSASNQGYGVFCMETRPKQVRVGAHRVAYELSVGPIPDGLDLDHLCRVRLCVNPAHLEPVTPAENIRRGEGIAPQNSRKTRCKQGHPFDEVNTYISSNGGRACRTCRRNWQAEWKRKQREASCGMSA